jgi:VanZ family protein
MTAVFRRSISRWGAALILMGVIFLFSEIPSDELPDFRWADIFVKKSGHAIGFGLLALSYWRGLGMEKDRMWLAWMLALLYAITDEFHQAYTPGRIASAVDVLIDSLGAGLAILLWRSTS